jgi:hypothetical protein
MTNPMLERLGFPGVFGLGGLMFSISFYFGSIAPAETELASLRQEAAQLQARLPKVADAGHPVQQEVRKVPASITSFPDLLKLLNTQAEQRGVAIDRAFYALTDRDGQRRMEINLPLRASYPSLRGYLRDVLMHQEPPSLDELTLKRQHPTDTIVDANIRLSFLIAPVP